MQRISLKASRSIGSDMEAEALVSRDPVHFNMDINLQTGIGIGVGHDLRGKNIAGKVLVIPSAKGGVASSMAIIELARNGCGPKALLFYKANPIMVQGAILADIPIMDGFERNPIDIIQSGDSVKVKPAAGVVEVNKAEATQ